MMNERIDQDKELIDRGTYYEIKDYEPIVKRDENGNVVSVIHCPYIPKTLVDEPLSLDLITAMEEDDERTN